MKLISILVLLSLSLCGCVTSDKYYTDPGNGGYAKPYYRGTCLNCDRLIVFSRSEFDKSKDGLVACPHCNSKQDMEMCSYQLRFDEKHKK